MNSIKINFGFINLILITTLLLAGCGGGGGGGDGGSRGGNSSRPGTGFRVLHAALDTAPVDVVLGAEGTVRTLAEFSQASDWVSTAAGTQSVELRRATTTSNVKSTSFSLSDGQVASVLLYGDKESFGERLSIIDDALPQVASGNAAVRVVHGVMGALQVTASVDSLSLTNGTTIGQASDFVEVPASSASTIRVRRAADGLLLFQSTENLQPGGVYTVLVSGNASYVTIGRVLQD